MERIAPYALWIGHAGDGGAFREIFQRDIRAVVQLALEEPTIAMPRELIYGRFPLLDGSGNRPESIRLATATVEGLMKAGISTLVCCGAGMSRSPAIVAAAISHIEGISFAAALGRVTKDRPADVSPTLIADITAAIYDTAP